MSIRKATAPKDQAAAHKEENMNICPALRRSSIGAGLNSLIPKAKYSDSAQANRFVRFVLTPFAIRLFHQAFA